MKLQEKAMLKAMLTRSSHEHQLLRILPPKLVEEIQSFPKPTPIDLPSLLSSSNWIKLIHYSWFYEPFKKIPPQTQALFLSALTPLQAKEISEVLKLTPAPLPTSRFVTPFLLNYLKKKLTAEGIVNEQHLPLSEMNIVLNLKRNQLLHLIDLLGVYDLAADLRQVVDKELLGKIYSALSSDQLHFLHYCSKQSIKWISPKLGLTGWDGITKTFRALLHQRGLIWLARAVIQEEPSFRWHLLHHLDTGRAKIIKQVFEQKQDLSITTYFKNQVLHIVKRYQ